MNRRVLFLAQYISGGGDFVHMLALAKQLGEHGWEAALACRLSDPRSKRRLKSWAPHIEASRLQLIDVPFPDQLISPLVAWRAYRKLARAVDVFQPSLLHVHWRSTSPFAALLKAQTGTPYLTTLHRMGMPAGYLARTLFSWWGTRAIAVSTEVADELMQRFHVASERVVQIPLWVDLAHFRIPSELERNEVRRLYGIRDGVFVVAVVASLYEDKRHDLVLEAVALLRQANVPVALLLAGDGMQANALRAQAKRLGIENVMHLLAHTDARSVYWAADVHVLMSRTESFSLATLEAMACGTVCIRTPTGGAADQIHDGVTGYLVPHNDPKALADRLGALYKKPMLRQQLRTAASAHVGTKFNPDYLTQKMISIYEAVCMGNG